jgi:hypothetical protein
MLSERGFLLLILKLLQLKKVFSSQTQLHNNKINKAKYYCLPLLG